MNYEWSGICASIISTTVVYPLDTLKSRSQSNIALNKSLYKGIRFEYLSSVPSSYMYWMAYKWCREKKYSDTISAASASCISNLIDSPFDLKKKMKQLNLTNNNIVIKYGLTNMATNIVYNIVYMNSLKYFKEKNATPISIFLSCNLAGLISFPLDKYKTYLVSRMKTNFFKGLGYRLLFCNLYSGLYMNLFLWFSNNKLP